MINKDGTYSVNVNGTLRKINSRAWQKLLTLHTTEEADLTLGWGCPAKYKDYYCTRSKGHSGAHVAHPGEYDVVAVWVDSAIDVRLFEAEFIYINAPENNITYPCTLEELYEVVPEIAQLVDDPNFNSLVLDTELCKLSIRILRTDS